MYQGTPVEDRLQEYAKKMQSMQDKVPPERGRQNIWKVGRTSTNQQKSGKFPPERDMQDKVDEIAMHIQQTEVHQEGRSNSEPNIQQNYIPCGQGITDTCIIVGHNCSFKQ